MEQNTEYIGIFAVEPIQAATELTNYARDCLEQLAGQVNSLFVQKDAQNFDSKFTLPNDNHHVNTRSLSEGKIHDILENFKNGEKMAINIQLCVYVPDTIIIGYVPTINVPCDNKYPHVILMLAQGVNSSVSNEVLEAVLSAEPQILDDNFSVKQAKGSYQGKSIFLIKKEITIQAITGTNLTNGKRN